MVPLEQSESLMWPQSCLGFDCALVNSSGQKDATSWRNEGGYYEERRE